MKASDIEHEIDRLYEAPLGSFTAERAALAKRVGGDGAGEIKSLPKPNLPAWAVNQLYRKSRETFEAVVKAAERLRAGQRAAVAGKRVDLQELDRAHAGAVKSALRETLSLLESSDQRATPATKQAIARTLQALPGDATPGRLSRALDPPGFEIFSGVIPARRPPVPPKKPVATAKSGSKADLMEARRAVTDADHELHRARFAASRATASAERAERKVEQFRREEERAQERWESAQKELAKAASDSARLKREAERAAAEVQTAETAARQARERLTVQTKKSES